MKRDRDGAVTSAPENTFAVGAPLPRSFFERDARVVARALVGTFLRVSDGDATRVVRIVETEAYRGPDDLACHARFGVTNRTKSLFAAPGHAYVFLIYGMYDCFNVTCFAEGRGHAVLVRAVEPVEGVAAGVRTDGPGRLTRVLGISRREFDGVDLCGDPEPASHIALFPRQSRPRVATSARVGVAYAGPVAEAPWRFFDAESRCVSKPSPRTIGLGVHPANHEPRVVAALRLGPTKRSSRSSRSRPSR